MLACQVSGKNALLRIRCMSGIVAGCQDGASRRTSHEITAYTISTTAVMINGARLPRFVYSHTVVRALMAVPPIPAPNTPVASPRRCGGYQAFTNGTQIAKDVPALTRNKPPMRAALSLDLAHKAL